MKEKFKALVREMDRDTLEALRRSVAREVEARRRKTAIQMGDIHPLMTAEQKQAAAEEIGRVLRGEDA